MLPPIGQLKLFILLNIKFCNGFVNNLDRQPQQLLLSTFSMSTNAKEMSSTDGASPAPSLFSESSMYNKNGLTKRRRWLVVDYDGTCTQHDTTPLLPKLAALATHSRSSLSAMSNGNKGTTAVEEYDHKKDLQRRLEQFQELEDEFIKRYSDAKSALLDHSELPENEERVQSIHDVLDALDEPSNIVTKMVSESRVLHGLGHADSVELEGMLNLRNNVVATEGDISTTSSYNPEEVANESEVDERVEIHLRDGCETTLARLLLSHSPPCQSTIDAVATKDDFQSTSNLSSCLGWSIAVLSINWCPALIDASLVQPILRKKRSLLNQQHCQAEVPIWCNHVDGEGMVTLHIPGALAKRDRIRELRRCLGVKHDDNGNSISSEKLESDKHLIVYVGDSSTDLAALLEADIGIIIGDSSSTRSIAQRWGIGILSLSKRHEHGFDVMSGVENGRGEQVLWQATSWHEINEMLEELDLHWK
jgi:phosphoserine phosphatase